MANQHTNKVIYGGQTLIDLTADTAVESSVLSGATFHKADGSTATGTCPFDANTQDATAAVAEVLATKTYYKAGTKMTGTMPNIGKQTTAIATKAQNVLIQQGYHDGSGSVSIDSTEQNKIIAENIKSGVTILGVLGDYNGSENVKPTAQTLTPYTTAKTYLPSDYGDYNYFSQVTVSAIAYTETDNAAGGKTVTIGTVAPA